MSSVISQALPATQSELVYAVIKHLDKHLAIPVLQFSMENPSEPGLAPQYRAALKQLAKKTYRFDLRRQLADGDEAELAELAELEEYNQRMLKSSSQAAQCLLQEFFAYDTATQTYSFRHTARDMDERSRQAKFSLPSLKRLFGATERHVRELATFANVLYEFGRYREAAMMLDLHKRCVTPRYRRRDAQVTEDEGGDDGESSFASPDAGACWGRFACAILLGNRDGARDAAQELIARLDSADNSESQVVAQHSWYVHWHLCMLAVDRAPTTDLLWLLYRDRKPVNFLKFRYTNTVLCAAAHLTPYIVATAVLNKSNAMMIQRAARIVDVEAHRLRDPLSQFIISLRLKCDFDEAAALIGACEKFMAQDYFMRRHAARFAEYARMMVCQNKLWVHRVMSTEKTGEMQLVRLIREANVDATIDSVSNTVHVQTLSQRTVWKQVLDTLSHVSVS